MPTCCILEVVLGTYNSTRSINNYSMVAYTKESSQHAWHCFLEWYRIIESLSQGPPSDTVRCTALLGARKLVRDWWSGGSSGFNWRNAHLDFSDSKIDICADLGVFAAGDSGTEGGLGSFAGILFGTPGAMYKSIRIVLWQRLHYDVVSIGQAEATVPSTGQCWRTMSGLKSCLRYLCSFQPVWRDDFTISQRVQLGELLPKRVWHDWSFIRCRSRRWITLAFIVSTVRGDFKSLQCANGIGPSFGKGTSRVFWQEDSDVTYLTLAFCHLRVLYVFIVSPCEMWSQ